MSYNHQTITIGFSVNKKPITATVIPSQRPHERTVLLVGAIHGDEPEGPLFLEELTNYYAAKENRPQKTRIAIIPIANPDGLKLKTRQNANGVDLNRNFPTDDWEDTKHLLEMYKQYNIEPSYENPEEYYYGGPSAASEPETQAIVTFMNANDFDCVIQLHSTRTHTTCPEGIINDGGANKLATRMAEHSNMTLSIDGVGYPTPGDFGHYAAKNHKTPAITIEFCNGMTKKEITDFANSGVHAGIRYIDELE